MLISIKFQYILVTRLKFSKGYNILDRAAAEIQFSVTFQRLKSGGKYTTATLCDEAILSLNPII